MDDRSLADAVEQALAGLPDGDLPPALDEQGYRSLRAGIRLGLERPDRARRLLELLEVDGEAARSEPRLDDARAAAPDARDPGDAEAIPARSSLLARAAALPPSERETLGPEVWFGWVEMLTPDEILLFGRMVQEMVATGSPRDLGRGFGLTWDAGVRLPHKELEAMFREFTQLEVTVAGVLAGRELRPAGELPQPPRGFAALFGSWIPRRVPGETQAAAALERSGEPGQRGLVALWNVWMAMRYRAALPPPTFDLLVRPWVAIVGPLPEA